MHTLFLILFSLFVSIVIAILGVIPSFFITAFNISYFGIGYGFLLSLIGESLGAIISFYLYRLGFKNISQKALNKHPKINKIINAPKREQIKLLLAFRVFPYMPSGLVTYACAISNMNIYRFVFFSTIGKIPAMVIEVLVVGGIITSIQSKNINLLILILSSILIIFIIYKIFKKGINE